MTGVQTCALPIWKKEDYFLQHCAPCDVNRFKVFCRNAVSDYFEWMIQDTEDKIVALGCVTKTQSSTCVTKT